MENKQRAQMYAFLSRMFSHILDASIVQDLKSDTAILEMLMGEEALWLHSMEIEDLVEALNVDFTSLFLMNSMPIESSVLEEKEEVLVGLQNPVMQFYFDHGYSLNLTLAKQHAPDHLSLECAFMQHLIAKQEVSAQRTFLEKHLLQWAPAYLLGIASMAQTPFYRSLCHASAEFFAYDYEELC